MQRATIDIPTADGTADALLVAPDGAPGRGVLLLMDAFGLRPQIEAMAERIARHGYTVLAPNLFYRAGRVPLWPMPDLTDSTARTAFFAEIRPLLDALDGPAIASDGAAYLDALASAAAPGPTGIVGYCMGVRAALRIAAAEPDRVAAVAGFHGARLVSDDPASIHLLAPQLRARLVLGHADHDASNPPEQIAAFDAALDAAGITHDTAIYPGPHGFTMADTPSYAEAAAERAHAAAVELFAATLSD